jgi:hypothetical protein
MSAMSSLALHLRENARTDAEVRKETDKFISGRANSKQTLDWYTKILNGEIVDRVT